MYQCEQGAGWETCRKTKPNPKAVAGTFHAIFTDLIRVFWDFCSMPSANLPVAHRFYSRPVGQSGTESVTLLQSGIMQRMICLSCITGVIYLKKPLETSVQGLW